MATLDIDSRAFVGHCRGTSHLCLDGHCSRHATLYLALSHFSLFHSLARRLVGLDHGRGLGLGRLSCEYGMVPRSVCVARNGSQFLLLLRQFVFKNAVVAHQVYRLVQKSHQRQRAAPPR